MSKNNFKLEKFDISKTYLGQKEFDCNNDMINKFVHKSLKKRVKKHLSQAYILLDNERFVGFYTLDTFSITKDNFELENKPSGLPPIVPVIKLSMLGVDKSLQGQGIGKRLLRDVFLKVYQISELAGCTGIYLLAEKNAIPFYENLGFVPIKNDEPLPMFLSLDVILETFSSKD
ncbi:MAG: FIG001353: Acetyltransferase [uncultured Sulfurovum sp.]|uniref:FIG001353: Acetyltransferase n=1 Tax=uncultured Sulfurovum sp. TaxID=269237 RepID=A0A6S6SXX4_9BACT|nr:MAG: FIG001353: Acetyltransferase [uncultured Sulfurovum sp.]